MSSLSFDTFVTTLKAVITVLVVYVAGFLVVKFKLISKDGIKSLVSLAKYLTCL